MAPRRRVAARCALDERGVVAVGDEADLLAVRLVGDRQAERARVLAHLGLVEVADREARARSCAWVEREQEVRLILGRDRAPRCSRYRPVGVVELDAGVVAGGDDLGAEARARGRRSVANFRSLLQCAQGIGVRPAAYSRTKFAMTVLVELRARN